MFGENMPRRENSFSGEILAVRKEGEMSVAFVGLEYNNYCGFVKVRHLQEVHRQRGFVTYEAGDCIECVPRWWCVVVGHYEKSRRPKRYDHDSPEGTFTVEEAKLTEATQNRLVRFASTPKKGTMEYVYRASSPRPASYFDKDMFELGVSELYTVGHVRDPFLGLFAKKELQPDFVLGEYLGMPEGNMEGMQNEYAFGVLRRATHTRDGTEIQRRSKRDMEMVEYIDGSDVTQSSFLRYVNAPTLDHAIFSPQEIEWLGLSSRNSFHTTERPGTGNAHFIQVESRIFLMTSCQIPAGKEILAPYGSHYDLPIDKRRILTAERARFLRLRIERPPFNFAITPVQQEHVPIPLPGHVADLPSPTKTPQRKKRRQREESDFGDAEAGAAAKEPPRKRRREAKAPKAPKEAKKQAMRNGRRKVKELEEKVEEKDQEKAEEEGEAPKPLSEAASPGSGAARLKPEKERHIDLSNGAYEVTIAAAMVTSRTGGVEGAGAVSDHRLPRITEILSWSPRPQ